MKTIRKNILVALVAVTSTWAGIAQAQDFKIGIVNTDRILRDSNVAKTAQAKLESEFLKREKDLNEAINTFKGTAEKFERDAPTLSEAQRLVKQKQLLQNFLYLHTNLVLMDYSSSKKVKPMVLFMATTG